MEAAAPTVLPESIIRYYTIMLSGSMERVVYYDGSGHYSEVRVIGKGRDGTHGTTSAPHRGAYVYSIDANDSTHATIVYDGGNSIPKDDLYFVTQDAGLGQSPQSAAAGGGTSFTLFSKVSASPGGAINTSQRIVLAAGGSAISGFVIGGDRVVWVLVRGVGSTLKQFGVSQTAVRPEFAIFDSKQALVATSVSWGADPDLLPGYKMIAAAAGAFPLPDDSDEAVALIPLPPGAYTAVFNAHSSGDLLCETYILPFSSATP